MTTVPTEPPTTGPSQATPSRQPFRARTTEDPATLNRRPFEARSASGAATPAPWSLVERVAEDGPVNSDAGRAATGIPSTRGARRRLAELSSTPDAVRGVADPAVVRVGEATVRLRPVRPGDGPLLTEVLLRMSQRTRWLRFHSPILRFSAAQLRSLTEVDHHDRSVVLAEVEVRPGRWQPVGFAQYARIGEDRADAAIVLEDAWQRRGIGRVLALRLVEAARAAGIAAFTSEVLSENRRTLDFVRALAPRTDGRLLGVTIELTSWLDPP